MNTLTVQTVWKHTSTNRFDDHYQLPYCPCMPSQQDVHVYKAQTIKLSSYMYKCCLGAHLMSSNSPSGGMKLMLLSDSNLLSLTHWWKVQSSMATLLRSLLPDLYTHIGNHHQHMIIATYIHTCTCDMLLHAHSQYRVAGREAFGDKTFMVWEPLWKFSLWNFGCMIILWKCSLWNASFLPIHEIFSP